MKLILIDLIIFTLLVLKVANPFCTTITTQTNRKIRFHLETKRPNTILKHKYNNKMTWTKENHFISPVDEIKIQYATLEHPNPTNTIIFFTGWKETYLKYQNLLDYFYKEGFNVYTMDHRSQGLSEDTPGSWNLKGHEDGSGKRVCYVEDFDMYVKDAYFFIQEIVKPSLGAGNDTNICVLSHSMGGPISARLAQLYPNLFHRMVLTAPMLMHKNTLDVGGLIDIELPYWLSNIVGTLITTLGLGRLKADGRDTNAAIPTTELMTNNKKNVESWNALRKAYPQVVLGGCSFNWVHGANKFESLVRAERYKIKIPTLVIGSDNDSFVYTKAMKDFCHPDNDVFTYIGPLLGTYHETLSEREEITDKLIPLICKFAKCNLEGRFDDVILKENIPLPPLQVGSDVRWKKGYHSGCCPPRFLPVPLVFRNRDPFFSAMIGAAVAAIAIVTKFFIL